MDLYSPVTNALANTQATIVDLMKVFMSNEIARQGMELEREKLTRQDRGLDLEAERNRLAVTKESAEADRARQEREDRLRVRGEDVAFRTGEAERTATHQGNVFELQKAGQGLDWQKAADEKEYKAGSLGLEKDKVGISRDQLQIEKNKYNQQFGKTTIGALGQAMGIDPYIWGFLNINKDAPTSPEKFDKMLATPYMARALPRAAVVRHADQLKTMEKQFLIEKDPAKKEQIKKNALSLSGQIDILRDAIESGPDKGLIKQAIESMGITDPDEAASAMETITNRWKGMQGTNPNKPRPAAWYNDPAEATEEKPADEAELMAYFKANDPAALGEAAAIKIKNGRAAGMEFLRKKRQAALAGKSQSMPNASEVRPGRVFGVRPGSLLDKVRPSIPRLEGIETPEEIPGFIY